MTNDEIRAFLDRFKQAWERQDVATLVACYTPDCDVVSPIFSTLHGLGGVEKSYVDLFKAFKFQKFRVDDIVIGNEEPPRAVVVWNIQSTHAGEVFGMPGSGKHIEQTVVFVLTFDGSQISREVRIYDYTSMLMQLGVLRARPA